MSFRLCFVLIGLLVFSGRAFAAPGAATLRSPSGIVTSTTITFTWDAVPEATWYQFWLGTASPSALVQSQWYTAAQVGCAAGGACSISLTPPLEPGGNVWFIQTWGGAAGPWSAGLAFTLRDTPSWNRVLPSQQRFTLVFGDVAVLDNETGLTWVRAPNSSTMQWANSASSCAFNILGPRLGWRVPEYHELLSVLSLSDGGVLPAGHPFTDFAGVYWSRTVVPGGTNVFVLGLSANSASLTTQAPTASSRTWCVRGPQR